MEGVRVVVVVVDRVLVGLEVLPPTNYLTTYYLLLTTYRVLVGLEVLAPARADEVGRVHDLVVS